MYCVHRFLLSLLHVIHLYNLYELQKQCPILGESRTELSMAILALWRLASGRSFLDHQKFLGVGTTGI